MTVNLTPRQLFRAARGAVRDVSNCHPAWKVDAALVNSIAKRLAGTLRSLDATLSLPEQTIDGKRVEKRVHQKSAILGPRRVLHFLGVEAAQARKQGNKEREQAFIDALKFLAPKRSRYNGS